MTTHSIILLVAFWVLLLLLARRWWPRATKVSRRRLKRDLCYEGPDAPRLSTADRGFHRLVFSLTIEPERWVFDQHCARYYRHDEERRNFNADYEVWIANGNDHLRPYKPVDLGKEYWSRDQKVELAEIIHQHRRP